MANINKYKSYKNIAVNYNHALSLISGRSLALGEPAVVLYYTPDVTSPDKKINMLFAIGSLNGKFSVFDPKKDNTIDPNPTFDPCHSSDIDRRAEKAYKRKYRIRKR